MAEAAASFLGEEGPAAAFATFTFGQGWHDRDLYVFSLDLAGISLAEAPLRLFVG